VLSALLSFHPETVLSLPEAGQQTGQGGASTVALIVFPSNRELSLRAQGLCERSLARHLATLADAGLIIRCDSPNGKRYARKGRDGAIETAFGFDLTPLVLRAPEFEDAADAARREAAETRAMRERCTLARRSAAGLIALAEEERVVGPWPDYALLLAGLNLPRRRAGHGELASLAVALEDLAAEIGESLRQAMVEIGSHQESGTARMSDSLHQNSNIDPSDLELASKEAGDGPCPSGAVPGVERCPPPAPEIKSSGQPVVSFGFVHQACPSLAQWAGEAPRDWPGFIRAAHVARAALGVSLDGWLEAVEAMGEQVAAVTIAAILERVEQAQTATLRDGRAGQGNSGASGPGSSGAPSQTSQPPALIRSPGGYLRSLSAKARAGTFRPEPFLMALIATRGRG
jgi:replication initiation protein RepC